MGKEAVETRLAREGDLPALWSLYGEAVRLMEGTAEDVGWKMGTHPSRGDLSDALREGGLLVATRGEGLVGSLVVGEATAEGYGRMPWKVEVPLSGASVVHLLVVSPRARGEGVARVLLDAAAALARSRGKRALRLDVFPNALHAAAVYRACGFADLGVHEIRYPDCDNTSFRLMERAL